MVCKLHKALYGLKQVLRAWYERLHSHLVKIGFQRTNEDSNIYLKIEGDKILVSEVFVDDMCHHFSNEMKNEIEMSLVGEIKKIHRFANPTDEGRNFYHTIQVCEGSVQNFWNGR